jgi:hypothetical protein
MAIDTTAPRTRRTIIMGAVGGLAAWAASAIGRPEPVHAHDPDDVALGDTNTGGHTTTIVCDGEPALEGHSLDVHGVIGRTDSTDAGKGVAGYASAVNTTGETWGVYGESASTGGTGVYGTSPGTGVSGSADSANGTGVSGSGGKYGVWGQPGIPAGIGVYGWGGPSTGVIGYSGVIDMGEPPPAARPKTGVFGYSDIDSAAVGVRGESTAGTGVRGQATSGTGGYFASTSGAALAVVGKATFSRSKRVTIGAGSSSLKVTLAGVTTSSLVFAVLHSNRAGVYVQAVVPASGSFTIYLNKAVTSATYVAYFVVN